MGLQREKPTAPFDWLFAEKNSWRRLPDQEDRKALGARGVPEHPQQVLAVCFLTAASIGTVDAQIAGRERGKPCKFQWFVGDLLAMGTL